MAKFIKINGSKAFDSREAVALIKQSIVMHGGIVMLLSKGLSFLLTGAALSLLASCAVPVESEEEREQRRRKTSRHTYVSGINCYGPSCQEVAVFMNYSLREDVSQNAALWLEVYDNPYLSGRALDVFRITDFDSVRAPAVREDINFGPGEYYLRAFVADLDSERLPAELQNFELTDLSRNGFAAISAAERLVVSPTGRGSILNININQALATDGNEPQTNAKIRAMISLSDEDREPILNRNVKLRLFTEARIDKTPAYEFTLSTNRLFGNSLDSAPYILTSDLEPGDYYVFAFVDEDGNDFYDEGELAAFYDAEMDRVMSVPVELETVKEIELTLDETIELP